jgi:hypothetical protein
MAATDVAEKGRGIQQIRPEYCQLIVNVNIVA